MTSIAVDPLFDELRERVTAAGFFAPDPKRYVLKGTICLALYVIVYVSVWYVTEPLPLAVLLFVLAQMSVQLAYFAHDAAHGSLTRNPRLAKVIGHFGMTFITGFSFSWWVHSHGNHHAHVNEEENDLAMKYSTVLAVHERAITAKQGWRRRLSRYQAYYIWLLIPLYHFPMIWDGFVYCWQHARKTRTDQIVIALYLLLWLGVPSLAIGWQRALVHYLADTLIGSTLIGYTFIVHHVGRKVVRSDEVAAMGPLRKQIETTRNVRTWRIFDFYYSGLNYHIPHHLFPNVPHWRYRALHQLIARFCAEKEIRYTEESFFHAVGNVFRYLRYLGSLPSEFELTRASERAGWSVAEVPAPYVD